MPFRQPLKRLHHDSTKAYLCSPLCPISISHHHVGDDLWHTHHGLHREDLVTALLAEPKNYSLLGMLNSMFEISSVRLGAQHLTKCSDAPTFHLSKARDVHFHKQICNFRIGCRGAIHTVFYLKRCSTGCKMGEYGAYW